MAAFGFSVGDFITVAGLINNAVQSLRTAGGAKAAYRELCADLDGLTTTLCRVQSLELGNGNGNDVIRLQKACVACLDKIFEFGKKTHKFQSTLKNGGSGNRLQEVKKFWHKIEWGILKEDQVREFKADLAAPLQTLAIEQRHFLLQQGNSMIGTQTQHGELLHRILGYFERPSHSQSNDSNLHPAYENHTSHQQADFLAALSSSPQTTKRIDSVLNQPDIDTKARPYEDFDSKIREPLPAGTGLGDQITTAFRVNADFKASDFSPTLSPVSTFNADFEGRNNSINYAEDVTPRTSHSDGVSKSVELSVKEVWSRNTNSPEPSELLSACRERKIDLLKQVLQRPDISLWATDERGRGVLHLALGSGKVNAEKSKMTKIANTVRLLSNYGADVNASDKSGLCPIHYCAKTINSEAARFLLKHGARVNELDSKGRTALNHTAEDSHPDVEFVKMLIARGGRLGTAKLLKLRPMANGNQRDVRLLIIKL